MPDLPTTTVTIGEKTFTLEIAADDAARAKGLMHRESMPAERGMIFVFPHSGAWHFWMKNTKIPLDLIFVDNAGKVTDITTLQPLDEKGYTTPTPARYVIELNAGTAQAVKLRKGDKIALPATLPEGK